MVLDARLSGRIYPLRSRKLRNEIERGSRHQLITYLEVKVKRELIRVNWIQGLIKNNYFRIY